MAPTLNLQREMRFYCFVVATAIACAPKDSAPPAAAEVAVASTPQDIAKEAFGGTVLLVMADAHGQSVSLGSGFLVSGGLIASNLHVIEGAASGYAKFVGQKEKYDIGGVTAIDAERDLVILKISGTGKVLALGNSAATQVGETVYAVGNPQGLEGTFSQGIVSSLRDVGADKLLQITAPISPGSSGGPVLNASGQVIGVSVATFRGGQNLNFAIPANYLSMLLERVGPPEALSARKSIKARRSIVAAFGSKSVEGVLGGDFSWSNQLYERDGEYSFTLRNQLRETVKDVYCMVVFYGRNGTVLDVDVVSYPGEIPANLGRRINGSVDASLKRLTTPRSRDNEFLSAFMPSTRIEFRILTFTIVN